LPGPAAYGKGGTEATTTDANLWLGRINRDYFCGGEIEADMAATETALTNLATRLDVTVDEAARGIVRIANDNMVNALKLVSLNRGHDTRDFTLLAFGGGGSMHAVALAQELQVKKVVVPAAASVFSAWGMMMSDLRRDYFATQLIDLDAGAGTRIEKVFAETEKEARATFEAEGVPADKISFLRYGKFRYQNQEHTTEVPLSGSISVETLSKVADDFHALYEKEYTYRLDAPVEMVGIHLVARAEIGKLTMAPTEMGPADASGAVKATRQVDYALEGIHEATIYDGDALQPGMMFEGPAIIEDSGSTVVVHPGNKVSIDTFANIQIALEG
ncbi:MAG: hydantoinase/oxoprolinase family protein, partial [Pseudomonadota bacterium]